MKAILILFFGLSLTSYTANESTYDFGSGRNNVNDWILTSKNMVRMSIMTMEKKEHPFSIEIDYIEFVK